MALTLGLGGLGALGGVGIAAVGAAAAGAIGLGLAAAAARHLGGGGGRRGGRRRGGGRRGGGRRHGRQIQQSQEEELQEEASVLERVLTLVRQQDVTGCGMRLMCELAGISEEALDEEQKAILNLVEPVARAGEGFLPPGGAGDYLVAKRVGQHHSSCSLNFPLCSLNGTELMDIVYGYLP